MHTKPKLSMFWGYLKIINTFLEKSYKDWKQIVWETQNGINISVGHAVLSYR